MRRLRQAHVAGELSLSESSALARVARDGPMTAAELARAEHISPQSMGTTLRGLLDRGLLSRAAHPRDGRRMLLSVSDAGREVRARRQAETAERLADLLASELTPDELERLRRAVPLLQRLAERL
ncbi:MAG: MarR family transcriptional regulator [Solirubrobacterales bacterium]|nr:MarR family transcriptional regulator [Solirubrobacterales bacterium]